VGFLLFNLDHIGRRIVDVNLGIFDMFALNDSSSLGLGQKRLVPMHSVCGSALPVNSILTAEQSVKNESRSSNIKARPTDRPKLRLGIDSIKHFLVIVI
jgi:hypothetical protein